MTKPSLQDLCSTLLGREATIEDMRAMMGSSLEAAEAFDEAESVTTQLAVAALREKIGNAFGMFSTPTLPIDDLMVERAASSLFSHGAQDKTWGDATRSSEEPWPIVVEEHRVIARRMLTAAFDATMDIDEPKEWLPDGAPVTAAHVEDLIGGIRTGQAEDHTILKVLERLIDRDRTVTIARES